VRCSGCHHALTAAFSRGSSRQYPYYLCQRHECRRRGKSRAAGEVHAEFESFLGEITPKPQLIQGIGERVIKAAAKSETEATAQRQRRRKRIADLEGEIQELIRMRAQNLITDQEFLPQKKRLLDQRVALDSPSQRTIDANQVRADVKEIVAPLSSLQNTWRSLHSPFRRRFERLILPGGFVIGNIRTADLGLLFSAFRASTGGDSSVVPRACVRSNRFFEEIQAFWDVLNGVEEPEPLPKRRFENSHRSRLRIRKSNCRSRQ
jgi:hypothetical protein